MCLDFRFFKIESVLVLLRRPHLSRSKNRLYVLAEYFSIPNDSLSALLYFFVFSLQVQLFFLQPVKYFEFKKARVIIETFLSRVVIIQTTKRNCIFARTTDLRFFRKSNIKIELNYLLNNF